MRRRHLYSVLAAVGLVGPYGFFVSFLTTHGPDGKEFLSELFATPISAFFAVDLLLSCVVFVVYLREEAARYSMQHRWLYLLALVTVGLSFALPLFLYARERRLEVLREKEGFAT